MKLIPKTGLLILASSLALLLPRSGQCFYNSSEGRWFSRDPAEDRGGLNIYAFAGNSAVNYVDGLGLSYSSGGSSYSSGCKQSYCGRPIDCSDPCGDAKRKGLDHGDAGGVVCCAGIAYPCLWRLPTPLAGRPGYAKANEIIERCLMSHEQRHAQDGCGGSCRMKRQSDWIWNLPQHECDAYYAELQCFQNGLRECAGDADCEAAVRNQQRTAAANAAAACAGANK